MENSKEQKRRVHDYRVRKAVHEAQVRRKKRDNIVAVLAVVVVGALAGVGQWAYVSGQEDANASASPSAEPTSPAAAPAESVEPSRAPAVPSPELAERRTWTGELVINGVTLDVELDGAAAPQAVSAVLNDAQTGYYDEKTCHRLTVSQGFSVLQCGSVDGSGSGDPAYAYGPVENAPADNMYLAGTIAMARQGNNPNSNGHQFFIVYGDTMIPSDSAGGYTVIGQVTGGLNDLITKVIDLGLKDPQLQDGPPKEPVVIESFTLQ